MSKSFRIHVWSLLSASALLLAACGGESAVQQTPTLDASPRVSQTAAPSQVVSTPVAGPTDSATEPSATAELETPTAPAPTATVSDLPPGRVQLQTSSANVYYPVYGTTTTEIFASIDANGPRDDFGSKGSGLTAASWGYEWQPKNTNDGCIIDSMLIRLDMIVTLPEHQDFNSLDSEIAANWVGFAEGVSTHEQQHVDINLVGASRIQNAMSAIPAVEGCGTLESRVETLWATEQTKIEQEQNAFHAREDARLAAQRAPVQSQIEVNTSRIDDMAARIDALDADLLRMDKELTQVETQLTVLKQQIDQISGAYPEGDIPPDLLAQYEEVREHYNRIAPEYNDLVDLYNATIAERNQLAGQHDNLIVATNELVEEFNWTR